MPQFTELTLLWRLHGDESVIEKCFYSLLIILTMLSLSNLKYLYPLPRGRWLMELYVLGWASLLAYGLFCSKPEVSKLMIGIALYRVFDIVTYRLYFFFVKGPDRPWTKQALRRTVFLALVNLFEIVVAFAVVYMSLKSQIQTSNQADLHSPIAALYFSSVTMLTVGFGDFTPTTDLARVVVMVQLGSIVVFALFLFPLLMSLLSSTLFSVTQYNDSAPPVHGEAAAKDN